MWAGDYNCRNVSWEDCVLEEKVVTVMIRIMIMMIMMLRW